MMLQMSIVVIARSSAHSSRWETFLGCHRKNAHCVGSEISKRRPFGQFAILPVQDTPMKPLNMEATKSLRSFLRVKSWRMPPLAK